MKKIKTVKTMTSPDYWNTAKAQLSKKDKKLGKIIASYEGEMMVKKGDPFFTLARAIAGQQISVKAADSIWKRVEAAMGKVTPENALKCTPQQLRACGFSAQKVAYMHSLAQHLAEKKALIKQWPKMSDDEIIAELTSIKGIGRWTAEMFLIFHLGRPDVFPVGDLGMLKAIYLHYNKSEKLPLSEVRTLATKWQPYRSVATWYLWRSLDPVPVSY
jgi:DNA-3-methyladenine glycosylase II